MLAFSHRTFDRNLADFPGYDATASVRMNAGAAQDESDEEQSSPKQPTKPSKGADQGKRANVRWVPMFCNKNIEFIQL